MSKNKNKNKAGNWLFPYDNVNDGGGTMTAPVAAELQLNMLNSTVNKYVSSFVFMFASVD